MDISWVVFIMTLCTLMGTLLIICLCLVLFDGETFINLVFILLLSMELSCIIFLYVSLNAVAFCCENQNLG